MPKINLSAADVEELRRRGATISGGSGIEPFKKWSRATATTIGGIKFPSKVQARVYLALLSMFGRQNIRLDVRMPLLAGAKENGRVLYQTCDFCIVSDGKPVLWIDAKTPRKSREWERGMAMWRQSWQEVILWDGIGDLPNEKASPQKDERSTIERHNQHPV